MLLRFEVSNHRSILSPVELSMVAVDQDRSAVKSFDLLNEKVLTVAGIYGPNASGKSNVLDALAWLSDAVRGSLRQWPSVVPRSPFRTGSSLRAPSAFEIEMIVKGVRYWYRLELDDDHVIAETLYHYPRRIKRLLFERLDDEVSLQRGLRALSGGRDLLTPTTLLLSVATRYNEPDVSDFADHLLATRSMLARSHRLSHIGREKAQYATESLFDADPMVDPPNPDRDTALALLRFADFGINDIHVVEDPADSVKEPSVRRRRLQFIHRIADEEVSLDSRDESDGTRTWFRLIGPILAALSAGSLVLLDEIDASLHPRLSARLIELFQDPTINRDGAQLIFTSHDTSLLNHLNRDEVWLTEKIDGATTLTALAEYGGDKVRRSMNIERAYLQGRFGAVPELDQHVLRRAMGLGGDPGDGAQA